MGRINYYINGVSLRDYGIYVSAAKKLLSLPERKAGISHSYDNEHGVSVDVNGYVKERKITLNCFTDVKATGSFVDGIMSFKKMLLEEGMFQLEVEVEGAQKRLSYWCYLSGEIDVRAKYVGCRSVGTFDLVLVEPCPMKRVYFVATTSADQVVELEFSDGSDHYYTVVWGDGETTESVAVGDVAQHRYETAGKYRLMVVGDVKDLSIVESGDNNTNINLEWNLFL